MATNTIVGAQSATLLKYDGTSWVWDFEPSPGAQINIGNVLALDDPNVQEAVIQILVNSFTDPRHISFYIDNHSPNDEIKELRNTIWQLLR